MAADSALEVALHLAEAFEAEGIDYLVGGSLASSLHGEPRSTQDVDFVADLELRHVEPWLRRLGEGYYFDRERIEQAIGKRRSFNVIHLGTMFKADVFVLGEDRPSRREMERRELYELGDGRRLWVASAEDVVLQKLIWYRLGNAVSDRQWRDVLSVLAVKRGALDEEYLREMAAELGLDELLERARREAES
jgi:hypothetical protein